MKLRLHICSQSQDNVHLTEKPQVLHLPYLLQKQTKIQIGKCLQSYLLKYITCHFFKYFSSSQIWLHSVYVSFTSQDEPTQISFLEKSQVDWEKSQGYKYCHLDAICFGLHALVKPYMNANSLCVVIDTRYNQLYDVIIGGFTSPLHDGPGFGTVDPKYYVSLDDPYIMTSSKPIFIHKDLT